MTQDDASTDPIGTDPPSGAEGGDEGADQDRESYHGYSVDDEDQPQGEGDSLEGDSLVNDRRGPLDPLDEGYSPPEKWSPGEGFGNTPLEESMGETFEQREAQEVPEADPYEQAEQMSVDEIEGVDEEREVGDQRAGRLVEPDEGAHEDTEKDVIAQDVGIDGAAAGAEEAAVHTIDEDDL